MLSSTAKSREVMRRTESSQFPHGHLVSCTRISNAWEQQRHKETGDWEKSIPLWLYWLCLWLRHWNISKIPPAIKVTLKKRTDATNKLIGCTTAIYLSILHVEFGNRIIKGATGRSWKIELKHIFSFIQANHSTALNHQISISAFQPKSAFGQFKFHSRLLC